MCGPVSRRILTGIAGGRERPRAQSSGVACASERLDVKRDVRLGENAYREGVVALEQSALHGN